MRSSWRTVLRIPYLQPCSNLGDQSCDFTVLDIVVAILNEVTSQDLVET